jgi:pyrophosphatase PpaX
LRKYPFYLFDLDGTLIDTVDLINECFRYLFRKEKAKYPGTEVINPLIGLPLKIQFRGFFPDKDERELDKLVDDYMDYQLEIYKKYLRTFPGVHETLDCLRSAGCRLALVTSRRRKSVELFTRELGFFGLFETVITPEDTDLHKPDPAPALLAIARLGQQKGKGLFVGDAEFDMACGKAADMETAFALWGPTDPETLKTKPDYLLKSMKELCEK